MRGAEARIRLHRAWLPRGPAAVSGKRAHWWQWGDGGRGGSSAHVCGPDAEGKRQCRREVAVHVQGVWGLTQQWGSVLFWMGGLWAVVRVQFLVHVQSTWSPAGERLQVSLGGVARGHQSSRSRPDLGQAVNRGRASYSVSRSLAGKAGSQATVWTPRSFLSCSWGTHKSFALGEEGPERGRSGI